MNGRLPGCPVPVFQGHSPFLSDPFLQPDKQAQDPL